MILIPAMALLTASSKALVGLLPALQARGKFRNGRPLAMTLRSPQASRSIAARLGHRYLNVDLWKLLSLPFGNLRGKAVSENIWLGILNGPGVKVPLRCGQLVIREKSPSCPF